MFLHMGGTLDAPQQRERVRVDGDECSRAYWPLRRVAGREPDLPARAEAACRECEDDRFEVGVEEEKERTVLDLFPVRGARADLGAVQENPECLRLRRGPVALCHPPSV